MLALKFRAWDKVDRKMYYIDGFRILEGKIYRCSLANNEFRDGVLETVHYVKDDLNKFILMQSTGLFDKNGIEIFEGDVVDLTDEGGLATIENPFVKIERDISGFIVVGDFPDSPITLKAFEEEREFMGADVRVVGNLYENPELLEEAENE